MIEFKYYNSGPNKGKINWSLTCPTIKEVQDLINDEDLTHAEFRDKYGGLKSRCRKNNWIKDLVFKKVKEDWSSYDSIEKIQEFIDDNNLSNSEFIHKYAGLYWKAYKNKWIDNLNFKRHKINRTTTLITFDDIQKLISENNLTFKIFKNKYPELIKRCIANKWLVKLNFFENTINEFDDITKEEIQELINQENLTKDDFILNYLDLYRLCYKNNWINDLIFYKKFNDWKSYTLEDVQKLVSDEELSYCEFKEKYIGLCNKCSVNNWINLITFKRINNDYQYYDSVKKVQELIDNENLTPTDFKLKYPGLYIKSRANSWLDHIIYKNNNKSHMEVYFDNLFPINLYPDIKRESMELDWLRSDAGYLMKPDVIINTENVKLVCEFQGLQHFIHFNNFWYKTEEDFQKSIERDNLKYKLLTEHGFTVIYFVDINYYPEVKRYVPDVLKPNNYIGGTTIMTNWDDLEKLIKDNLNK